MNFVDWRYHEFFFKDPIAKECLVEHILWSKNSNSKNFQAYIKTNFHLLCERFSEFQFIIRSFSNCFSDIKTLSSMSEHESIWSELRGGVLDQIKPAIRCCHFFTWTEKLSLLSRWQLKNCHLKYRRHHYYVLELDPITRGNYGNRFIAQAQNI